METIHRNVKQIREERQLSVRDLAKRAGVSASYIYAIEAGKRGRNLEKLQRIAQALEVPIARLWGSE